MHISNPKHRIITIKFAREADTTMTDDDVEDIDSSDGNESMISFSASMQSHQTGYPMMSTPPYVLA